MKTAGKDAALLGNINIPGFHFRKERDGFIMSCSNSFVGYVRIPGSTFLRKERWIDFLMFNPVSRQRVLIY